MITDLEQKLRAYAATVNRVPGGDFLRVNDELNIGLIVNRCTPTNAGAHRWTIRLDVPHRPDITIATRMAPGNERPLDYYLLPSIDMTLPRLRLREENRISMDVYRFDSLQYFFQPRAAFEAAVGRVDREHATAAAAGLRSASYGGTIEVLLKKPPKLSARG
jgi:hypothetical protein